MSRARSAQPTIPLNSSLTVQKDKSFLPFTPQVNSSKANGENPYLKNQIPIVPEYPQGYLDVETELGSGNSNQLSKRTTIQKRKREMNAHVVNPNSLMFLQVPQNQQGQAQRPTSTVRKNSVSYNQDPKFNQIVHLNPQKINVKSKQGNQRAPQENQEETFVKAQFNNSSAVIINETESKMIHQSPSKGTISSFAFKREKVFLKSLVNPEYVLNQNNGSFLINAQKQSPHFNSYYSISSSRKQFSNDGAGFSGYLQGNFTGSEFNLYQKKGASNQLIATICYKTQFVCSSTYRVIEIYVKNPQFNDQGSTGNDKKSLKELYLNQQQKENKAIIKLINKKPVWSQKLQCYTMNFHGKSALGSTKNTILVQEDNPRNEVMLFCKTGQHDFMMQLRNPLTPFIAMGIVLSSFDFKLCCQ